VSIYYAKQCDISSHAFLVANKPGSLHAVIVCYNKLLKHIDRRTASVSIDKILFTAFVDE